MRHPKFSQNHYRISFFFKYSRRGQAFCVGSLHVTAVWMLQCWTSTFHIDLLRGFCERYPAWYSQKKMRTGTWPWIYSDDLPSYNMVDFYSYVNVYQRVETPVILHVFFYSGKYGQWGHRCHVLRGDEFPLRWFHAGNELNHKSKMSICRKKLPNGR